MAFDIDYWVGWLKGKVREYNEYLLAVDKNSLTLKELNAYSNKFLMRFYYERLMLRTVVQNTPILKEAFFNLCKDDFLLWVLFEGVTKDINRNPTESVQPIIPFYHQLPLIEGILDDSKNLHVEKSRRQGASLWHGSDMSHDLIFGDLRLNFTTHKDKGSLWEKYDETNSTFGKIQFQLKHSMFNGYKNKILLIPNFQDVRIVMGSNVLSGEVLSPNTAVGFQANKAYIDEIDPVCEMYPNQAYKITSGFAASSNRLLLFSTYRSDEYPFYQLKETHDTKRFNFVVMDWRDHPLCNDEWYAIECSKLNNDKVLIARELDHNPTEAIRGRVFDKITSENEIIGFKPDADWKRLIFADFGGGTSATAFIFAYYSTGEKLLYLDSAMKTTDMNGEQIKKEFAKRGFTDVPVVGDISATAQPSFKDSDWAGELRKNGIKFIPVNNKGMGTARQQVNLAFENLEIYFNKNSIELRDVKTYKWKGEDVDKGDSSHIGDALCYGFRYLYQSGSGIGYLGR